MNILREVQQEKQVPTRRCSRVLGQRRNSLYYKYKAKVDNKEVREKLLELSRQYPSWGFGLLFDKIRLSGKRWNKKRVYRQYKKLNLHLRKPQKRPKIKRVNSNNLAAAQVNQGWSLDFLSDDVVAENKARILNVMDEFSRKCLMADANKVYKAKQLVTALENLIATYGKPEYIRCDNGPELVSKKMAKFCKKQGIEIRFTQPGKPMQNGLVERLNGTIRTECLNPKVFTTINQIQAELDEWWRIYNFERPHSSLKGKTPQQIWLNQEELYLKMAAA